MVNVDKKAILLVEDEAIIAMVEDWWRASRWKMRCGKVKQGLMRLYPL
jgi:hypothetical protein